MKCHICRQEVIEQDHNYTIPTCAECPVVEMISVDLFLVGVILLSALAGAVIYEWVN